MAALPFLPAVAEWVDAVTQPVLMDTRRTTELLGWRPRYSGLEALRAALGATPTDAPTDGSG